jgi:hypothetical protein
VKLRNVRQDPNELVGPPPQASGSAVLRCWPTLSTEALRIRDCRVMNELPAGQGVGAYALVLAQAGTIVPPRSAHETSSGYIEFATDIPPGRDTDAVRQHELPAEPAPALALAPPVSGYALLDCRVLAGGRLTDCRVVSQTPARSGVAEVALRAAREGRLRAHDVAAGERVNMRVNVNHANGPAPGPLRQPPVSRGPATLPPIEPPKPIGDAPAFRYDSKPPRDTGK